MNIKYPHILIGLIIIYLIAFLFGWNSLETLSLYMIIIWLVGGVVSYFRSRAKSQNNPLKTHYTSHGLSSSDQAYFRNLMNKTRTKILKIKNLSQTNPRIEVLLLRRNSYTLLTNYFQAIVNNPDRLHLAGNFLYRDLIELESNLEYFHKLDQVKENQPKLIKEYQEVRENIINLTITIEEDFQNFILSDEAASSLESYEKMDLSGLTDINSELTDSSPLPKKDYNYEAINKDENGKED